MRPDISPPKKNILSVLRIPRNQIFRESRDPTQGMVNIKILLNAVPLVNIKIGGKWTFIPQNGAIGYAPWPLGSRTEALSCCSPPRCAASTPSALRRSCRSPAPRPGAPRTNPPRPLHPVNGAFGSLDSCHKKRTTTIRTKKQPSQPLQPLQQPMTTTKSTKEQKRNMGHGFRGMCHVIIQL